MSALSDIRDALAAVEQNPLAVMALAVEHLDPSLLSHLADSLGQADAAAGAAKDAAAAAQAAQDAALAAANPPIDEVPAA